MTSDEQAMAARAAARAILSDVNERIAAWTTNHEPSATTRGYIIGLKDARDLILTNAAAAGIKLDNQP